MHENILGDRKGKAAGELLFLKQGSTVQIGFIARTLHPRGHGVVRSPDTMLSSVSEAKPLYPNELLRWRATSGKQRDAIPHRRQSEDNQEGDRQEPAATERYRGESASGSFRQTRTHRPRPTLPLKTRLQIRNLSSLISAN